MYKRNQNTNLQGVNICQDSPQQKKIIIIINNY